MGAVQLRARAARSASATKASAWWSARRIRLATVQARASGSRSVTLRSWCSWQRWMIGGRTPRRRRGAGPWRRRARPGSAGSPPAHARAARPADRSPPERSRWRPRPAQPDLGPIDGDAERDHPAGSATRSRRPSARPGPGWAAQRPQLGQAPSVAADEPARDRRPGGPRAGLVGAAADRLQPNSIAAGRPLGQHPLHRQLVQQLGRGERLPGGQRPLGGAIGAADPRPIDPDRRPPR